MDEYLASLQAEQTWREQVSAARAKPRRLRGVTGLPTHSMAITEQVRTIARVRVVAEAGELDQDCFHAICRWVHRWIAAPHD